MSTISAREVSIIMPKWIGTDSISGYCKKVRIAWNYCEKESFDEEKFCKILTLQLPEDANDVLDSLDAEDKKKVEKILLKLTQSLGRKENDYLRELSMAKKDPSETHNHFARRIQRLYRLGTGAKVDLAGSDKKLIVDFFLRGLDQNEENMLRLIATDSEMSDIDALANRASRSTAPSTSNTFETINAVTSETEIINNCDLFN